MKQPDFVTPLKNEMESIRKYLASVKDILVSGYMPDITGLEQRVAGLCDSLKNAPREVQQECLPEFTDLLKHMDACESDMRAFQDARPQD